MKKLMMAALSLFVSFTIVGCEEKSPLQKAAQNVDNTIDQRGPVEKTVDKATGK